MIVIGCKLKDIHTRIKANTLVEEDFKDEDRDEEEDLVEDVAKFSIITVDRQDTT